MSVPPSLPILISGAGISGLALGQALLKASIPFHIYERDHSISSRPQGYRFRIHNAGVKALAEMLPPTVFSRIKATCALSITGGPPTVLDALTAQPSKHRPFGAGRPGVPGGPGKSGGPPPAMQGENFNADRTVLRRMLLRGLEAHVSFGKEFASYTSTANGITIHFRDGTSASGPLLVAADGAMSRIRRQFLTGPEHELLDTEGRIIYGKTDLNAALEEGLNPSALKAMMLARDSSHGADPDAPLSLLLEPIRFQQNEFRGELPLDYIYWVLIARADTLAVPDAELLNITAADAVALSKTVTAQWDSSFRILFELQNKDQTSAMRILSSKPVVPEWEAWENRAKITLVGDAAHVMSPSAAMGATTAVRDAAALAKAIIEDGVNGDSIAKYEEQMRGWAAEALNFSKIGGKSIFGMRDFEDLKPVGA